MYYLDSVLNLKEALNVFLDFSTATYPHLANVKLLGTSFCGMTPIYKEVLRKKDFCPAGRTTIAVLMAEVDHHSFFFCSRFN